MLLALTLFPLLPNLLTLCSVCQDRAGTGKSDGTQQLLKPLHTSGSRLMKSDELRKATEERTQTPQKQPHHSAKMASRFQIICIKLFPNVNFLWQEMMHFPYFFISVLSFTVKRYCSPKTSYLFCLHSTVATIMNWPTANMQL